eukprot:gene60539-82824_t
MARIVWSDDFEAGCAFDEPLEQAALDQLVARYGFAPALPERPRPEPAGGGYGVIVYNGEGLNTAKSLAEKGISAFVLKYRLPSDEIMPDKKIGPLQDVQQSIKYLRENADKYGIDKNKIGIMGFSAGGHLASTAATHFEKSYIENVQNTNLRPDFQILVYPVITMQDALTHGGSRDALIGKNPLQEDKDLFSNELQVKANTPMTWLTHAADDKVVDVDNSVQYYQHPPLYHRRR